MQDNEQMNYNFVTEIEEDNNVSWGKQKCDRYA